MAQEVICRRTGGIVTLVINRPEEQNMLSDALREWVGSSEDAREGIAAHLEGRPPKYKGQ